MLYLKWELLFALIFFKDYLGIKANIKKKKKKKKKKAIKKKKLQEFSQPKLLLPKILKGYEKPIY